MDKQVKIVIQVVGALGIISISTGFAAEFRRIKASDVELEEDYSCLYPSNPSFVLGVISAVALASARFALSSAGGWSSCLQRYSEFPDITFQIRLYSLFSWTASLIALILLAVGANLSTRRGLEERSDDTYRCYFMRPGIFAGGALLSFAALFMGIIFYVKLSAARKKARGSSSSVENPASNGTSHNSPTAPRGRISHCFK